MQRPARRGSSVRSEGGSAAAAAAVAAVHEASGSPRSGARGRSLPAASAWSRRVAGHFSAGLRWGVGMASAGRKRIIQFTGFKKQEKKALLKWLFRLDCVFIDTKKYRNCTHLIAKKLCKSEKFLAACSAGKWILTKEYIINSAESGRWLDETTYEWGYEIEEDTHYSPQMQSAPKRWREELTHSGAPGAFHRWKVVLPFKEGDKQMASIRRVLQAGKAVICSSQKAEGNITHIFVSNKTFPMQSKNCLSEAHYYPVQYLGHYIFENEIQNTKDAITDHFPAAQGDKIMSNMQLAEMKNAVIKHMYFAEAVKHKFAQKDQLNRRDAEVKNTDLSRGTWYILEGLVEEYLFPDVITELAANQKYFTPPVQLINSLLEYVLLGNTDALFYAKFYHVLYLVLQHDPPWKSPSMLKYYLELLQCPVCKKGTWSLIEVLVRSCLYCKAICHAVPVSGGGDEQRIVHKRLLKFFFELVKSEVEYLTKSLVEGTNSQHQQVRPQTVLLKTFWLGSETSVLFTKNLLLLHITLYGMGYLMVILGRLSWLCHLPASCCGSRVGAFICEVGGLLNAILGTVVEYWIISSLLMDRNVFNQISDGLAQYLAIACDDFSVRELEMFICSIPSLWLQMFVAEAVFKKLCLQRSITISTEPLSLQKIVSSYLPILQEIGMHEEREIHKTKKIGQWPCPGSQRALQMLNGNKNEVKVLPDLPDLVFKKRPPLAQMVGAKAEGETALHKACISNKVERLIRLLSLPGIDINVKDYAGWTPLHEACNHGSTVCVREILQRCPEVDLLSQVDGVTPLHDALSNGHVEIGKLLLQYGGPVLLQQRDCTGNLPLDCVESIPVKQELLNVVHPEESIESFYERTDQDFYSQQRELLMILFNKMLLNFCSVYNLSSPFTLTLREVGCSNVLPVMARDNCEMKNTFSADWLVDMYFKELETFQKLPQFLQEISANMDFFPGEQMKALLATLETIVEAFKRFA
ncbi:SMC5-SMC6 complex localization factor protein 1 isoform X4 [Lathamus discolor]|uniref:SMC5-SMC6 complex localization factor protein 1 isoform X4 n=1 Tax=Lathamus discolor TaxID=678569 RepID=UPI0032B7DB82